MAPDPRVMTWTSPTGTKSKSIFATFQGRKLRIQTPACRCRLFRDSSTASLYLYADPTSLHESFWSYVSSLETFCSAIPHMKDLEASSCIRNETSIRLNVWESTEWFDMQGVHVQSPETLAACSCILEFTGCWLSATGKWGLKWKVVQIKEEPVPPKQELQFLDDDDVPPSLGTECMFLDD